MSRSTPQPSSTATTTTSTLITNTITTPIPTIKTTSPFASDVYASVTPAFKDPSPQLQQQQSTSPFANDLFPSTMSTLKDPSPQKQQQQFHPTSPFASNLFSTLSSIKDISPQPQINSKSPFANDLQSSQIPNFRGPSPQQDQQLQNQQSQNHNIGELQKLSKSPAITPSPTKAASGDSPAILSSISSSLSKSPFASMLSNSSLVKSTDYPPKNGYVNNRYDGKAYHQTNHASYSTAQPKYQDIKQTSPKYDSNNPSTLSHLADPVQSFPATIHPPVQSSLFPSMSKSPFANQHNNIQHSSLAPYLTAYSTEHIDQKASPFSSYQLPPSSHASQETFPFFPTTMNKDASSPHHHTSPFTSSYFPVSTLASTESTAHSSYFTDSLVYTTPGRSTNPFLTSEYITTKTEVTEHKMTETEEITTTKKYTLNSVDPDKPEEKPIHLKVNGICSRECFII